MLLVLQLCFPQSHPIHTSRVASKCRDTALGMACDIHVLPLLTVKWWVSAIPLFIGFQHHPRWLFGISAINSMDDLLLDITSLLVWIILSEHQRTTQTTGQQKSVVLYDPVKRALEDRNVCLSACMKHPLKKGRTSFLAAFFLWTATRKCEVQSSGEVQHVGMVTHVLRTLRSTRPTIWGRLKTSDTHTHKTQTHPQEEIEIVNCWTSLETLRPSTFETHPFSEGGPTSSVFRSIFPASARVSCCASRLSCSYGSTTTVGGWATRLEKNIKLNQINSPKLRQITSKPIPWKHHINSKIPLQKTIIKADASQLYDSIRSFSKIKHHQQRSL